MIHCAAPSCLERLAVCEFKTNGDKRLTKHTYLDNRRRFTLHHVFSAQTSSQLVWQFTRFNELVTFEYCLNIIWCKVSFNYKFGNEYSIVFKAIILSDDSDLIIIDTDNFLLGYLAEKN